MASYATVPAADLESEATLLNSKPKTKTSLLVGGVAAAAFVLGVLSMTALRTSPSVRSAAFDANTGRTDPINIILFGSKERAETPNGMCLDIPRLCERFLWNNTTVCFWLVRPTGFTILMITTMINSFSQFSRFSVSTVLLVIDIPLGIVAVLRKSTRIVFLSKGLVAFVTFKLVKPW